MTIDKANFLTGTQLVFMLQKYLNAKSIATQVNKYDLMTNFF